MGHRIVPLLAALVAAGTCVAQDRAEPAPPIAPEQIAQAFVEGCVLTEGELTPTVDWAINAGYLPVDMQAVDVRPLLGGQAGTVLAMPGSGGSVLLAVTADRGCTVWAERQPGPALRAAFQQALARLGGGGARLQPVLDRSVERAGAWRQHLQLRYRRVGGSRDFAVGAVTTLTAVPAQQALHLSPSPQPGNEPDGPVVNR